MALIIDTIQKKVYNLFKQLCWFQNVHFASRKILKKSKIIITLQVLSKLKKRISNL